MKVDDLQTDKNVLLLISSGLEISKERAAYLGKVYKDCHQKVTSLLEFIIIITANVKVVLYMFLVLPRIMK